MIEYTVLIVPIINTRYLSKSPLKEQYSPMSDRATCNEDLRHLVPLTV